MRGSQSLANKYYCYLFLLMILLPLSAANRARWIEESSGSSIKVGGGVDKFGSGSGSDIHNLDGDDFYLSWWGPNIIWVTIYTVFVALYVVVAILFRCFKRISCKGYGCCIDLAFLLKFVVVLLRPAFNYCLRHAHDPYIAQVLFISIFFVADILVIVGLGNTLFLLRSGCCDDSRPQVIEGEEADNELGRLILYILALIWSVWEKIQPTVEPCDALSDFQCFRKLNLVRCARNLLIILPLLFPKFRSGVPQPRSRRSNLFFLTVLAYFTLMHASFTLGIFPSTSTAGLALGESATLALFLYMYRLHSPTHSAALTTDHDGQDPDNDLGAELIPSQP